MDLIDRQAAIDAFTDEIQVTGRANAESIKAYVKLVIDRIKRLPSEQPEIIYCKDCAKHEYCRTSTTWAVAPKDDWYCADAERRADDR